MASEKRKDSEDILSKIREDQREFWKGMRKLEESQRKTEESHHKTEESHRKTEESLRELQEVVKEVSKTANKFGGEFNRKWGDFMENLIEGDLVSLLRNWGLKMIDANIQPIPKVVARREDGNPKYELDLIVKNGDYAIIVEVKTTLTVPKVDDFLEKLAQLKDDFSAYKNRTIYACVAYLRTDKGEEKEDRVLPYLEENGLFAIRAPGGPANIATIANSKGFTPKKF